MVLTSCRSKPFTLRVEKAELQKRVEQRFPLERSFLLSRVRFTDPKVLLRSGSDRIGLSLNVAVQPPLLGRTFRGVVELSGNIEYESREKTFYLKSLHVDRLQVVDLPAEHSEQLRRACEVAAQESLERIPVVQLRGRNGKESAAALILHDVKVQDGTLLIELGLSGN